MDSGFKFLNLKISKKVQSIEYSYFLILSMIYFSVSPEKGGLPVTRM